MGTVGLLGADWSNNPPGPAPKKPGKNLYTNPGRRGGMGFSHKDRTIGQNPPTYMPDTYQHGRQLGKELRRKARERIVKPFNSSPNKGNGMFNSNPFKNPPGPDTMEEKANKVALKKPFIPSNPPKKGAAYETISKTGREYVPNPVVEAKVSFPLLMSALSESIGQRFWRSQSCHCHRKDSKRVKPVRGQSAKSRSSIRACCLNIPCTHILSTVSSSSTLLQLS